MTKIKILDESTIQKIAAGEIIERPASIVKELIENSIDANSSSITVEITNGGKNYIRVTDNGDGFTEDDLKIAFKRHSTSKLNSIEDLYKIFSFGFRGEALASISAVSKVEVLTKTENNLSGLQAFVEDGKVVKLRPVGCPKGTTMIVKNLFYNFPVRESFLKSDTIEANQINDIIYKLALGNSGVSFKFIKDNRVIFNTSANNDLKSNIYALLGKDFLQNLVKTNYESSDFNIYGYISNNTFYRGNRSHQYLFVNNRYIKNEFISNLIEHKYKSIIPVNRFPVFVLFIDIDPLLIDVNIHPTKQEIKFINQEEISDALDNTIDSILNEILSIPRVSIGKDNQREVEDELPLLYEKTFIDEDSIKNNNKEDLINIYEDLPIKEIDINTKDYETEYINQQTNRSFQRKMSIMNIKRA